MASDDPGMQDIELVFPEHPGFSARYVDTPLYHYTTH